MGLIDAIVDTVNGDFVPESVEADRKLICRRCSFNRGIGTCIVCGCFVAWKVKMPQESCPKGKWDKSESEPIEGAIPLV